MHAGGCIIVMSYIKCTLHCTFDSVCAHSTQKSSGCMVKVHHQHWHQGSHVEGEACIDGREGDKEGVSGGQEEADRCRDAGRMVLALEGLGHSF